MISAVLVRIGEIIITILLDLAPNSKTKRIRTFVTKIPEPIQHLSENHLFVEKL